MVVIKSITIEVLWSKGVSWEKFDFGFESCDVSVYNG